MKGNKPKDFPLMQKIVLFLLCFSCLYGNEITTCDDSIPKHEKELYLSAGGKYTLEDIAANGSVTRSQKFKNFVSTHDRNPQAGDILCPVTGVKANPECVWIIAKESYQFCCPNCIDEFLILAKEQPEKVKTAASYVK